MAADGSNLMPLDEAIRGLVPWPELTDGWTERQVAAALVHHRAPIELRDPSADPLADAIQELTAVDVDDDWVRRAISNALDDHLAPNRTDSSIEHSGAPENARRIELVHWERLARSLPAAAAGPGAAGPELRVASADDSIVVVCQETAAGRIVLRIEADEPHDALVEVLWRRVSDHEFVEQRLVTPLAVANGRWAALYALDDIGPNDELELRVPRWCGLDELAVTDVAAAIDDGAFGLARRAWRALATNSDVAGHLRALIDQLLEES